MRARRIFNIYDMSTERSVEDYNLVMKFRLRSDLQNINYFRFFGMKIFPYLFIIPSNILFIRSRILNKIW